LVRWCSPDLELWLDGADVDGDGTQEGTSEATLTGTQVDDWIDKSGNGRNFSRVGSPQLQSISGTLYSIASNGDDHFESDDANSEWTFIHSGDVTIIIRMEIDALDLLDGDANRIVFSNMAGSTSSHGIYFAYSDRDDIGLNEDFFFIVANATSTRTIYTDLQTALPGDDTFFDLIFSTDVDATYGSPDYRIPFREVDGTSFSIAPRSTGGGTASSGTPSHPLHILANTSTGSEFEGSIAEYIVYSRKLTSSEIDDLQDYLNSKY